jgi:hypothetical protein
MTISIHKLTDAIMEDQTECNGTHSLLHCKNRPTDIATTRIIPNKSLTTTTTTKTIIET